MAKINPKLLLELIESGMSRRQICSSRHVSPHTVSEVKQIAEKNNITTKDIKNMSEDDVYRMFFPDRNQLEDLYEQPDYEYVHGELKRTGVTLKLLWQEYQDKCASLTKIPMGYTKYCRGYNKFVVSNSLTNHLEHKPGIAVQVDWSGPTMEYLNPETLEPVKAYLFVATLPYSQYSYVEACRDMKQDSWLRCHIHMYEFFGGVPIKCICDNLKTGVIKHPKEGEIVLNEAYEALGNHYMTAIMPTGVRKPKQKASVEGTVGKVATAIIAALRDQTFYSLEQLQIAVLSKLEEFNKRPFQKRDASRWEVFQEEKKFLNPLPDVPYEIATWIYRRKVNLNCHVVYEKNNYSCPYQYVGSEADLKVTDKTVEIFVKGNRVATHQKFAEGIEYRYSTHPQDMPDQFQQPEWDDARIRNWAYKIGPNCGECIDRIFAGVKIKEQGYNPSLSLLRLSKKYSDSRLESACKLALLQIRSPRYHHLNAILAANQDILAEQLQNKPKTNNTQGYIRGSAYYGGNEND